MNKTLLLIMCDFLLLNLLALTRWEKAEPPSQQKVTAVKQAEASAPPFNADMLELMRVSLEDEKSSREKLSAQLNSTKSTLSEREQNLSNLSQQKTSSRALFPSTAANVKELEKKYSNATNEAFLTKEQLAKMQRELEERKAEAERQAASLAALERQNADARQRIENLEHQGGRVPNRRRLAQTKSRRSQATGRTRAHRTHQSAGADDPAHRGRRPADRKSGELTKEIRDNKPVNPTSSSPTSSPIASTRRFTRSGPVCSPHRPRQVCQTILVTDGDHTYALMHVSDTPFYLTFENPPDYEQITGKLSRGSFSTPFTQLQFLAADPRIVVATGRQLPRGFDGRKNLPARERYFSKPPTPCWCAPTTASTAKLPFRIDAPIPATCRWTTGL